MYMCVYTIVSAALLWPLLGSSRFITVLFRFYFGSIGAVKGRSS